MNGAVQWSVTTHSLSPSDMIVTVFLHRDLTIIQKFIVSLEQHGTRSNDRQEHVVYNNQTKLETTFTMLS